jgi:regulator of sigma E protease
MFFTIIVFLAVLSLLVFVHEMGHFWTARKFGVKAEEFGFGYPPRIFGFYKNKEGKWKKVAGNKEVKDASDTIYSINWIPIGGFVNIKGENGDDPNEKDSFSSKPIWQRVIILLSGVTMNWVLAFVLITFGFIIGLPQVLDGLSPHARVSEPQIQIIEVFKDSPAEKANFKVGDVIMEVNNQKVSQVSEIQKYAQNNVNKEVKYLIKQGDAEIEKNITPVMQEQTGQGGIGVGIVEVGIVSYPIHIAIWEGAKTTVLLTWAILVAFYNLLKDLFTGQGVSAQLAGPIGIAVLTGQMARMGLAHIIQFVSVLSINLAIINILPFPALDGGRTLFLIIEKIKGKPVRREVEGIIHYIGFILLMILVVLVTYKDFAHYTNIGSKIQGLFN